MTKLCVIQTIMAIAEMVQDAQTLAEACKWWTVHKDWADNATGAERNAVLAFRLGRSVLELWEAQEYEIRNFVEVCKNGGSVGVQN